MMALINIEELTIQRLEERIKKINICFGYEKSGIKDLDSFINKVLSNYCKKQENLDAATGTNIGVPWAEFRRKNFTTVYMRDKGRCMYCTKRLSRKEATLDHILSPSRNGLNTLENMKLSCGWCNNDKGVLTDEEYFYKQLVNASKGIYPPK